MNSASQEASSVLEIRRGRASSVIVQRIGHEDAERFLEWQHGISAEAARFPGYQTTDLFPAANEQEEWLAIMHFADPQTLQAWLDSPQRVGWIAKLPCERRDFRLQMLPSGFGSWFAGMTEQGQRLPHWKAALTVLFGLYPTVMFLAI